MRKFLKRIRKGFKTACLSAVLATCWQAGQVAQADMVTVQISGTVSPTVSNISHLYLLYGTGSSDMYIKARINIGDCSAGQNLAFQEEVTFEHWSWESNTCFGAIGLYGDIGEEYTPGINGVTLGLETAEQGDLFDSHCYGDYEGNSYDEEDVFNILLDNDLQQMEHIYISPMLIIYAEDLHVSGTLYLYNFSGASANGQIDVHAAIPEPVSLVLFGTGLTIFVAGRRRKK